MTLNEVNKRMTDLSKGVIPIGIAVAAIIALIGLAFTMGGEYRELQRDKTASNQDLMNLKKDFEVLRDSIRKDIGLLQEAVKDIGYSLRSATLPEDLVRKSDLVQLCLTAEIQNKGFRCPEQWRR
jgi:hypothetical protein